MVIQNSTGQDSARSFEPVKLDSSAFDRFMLTSDYVIAQLELVTGEGAEHFHAYNARIQGAYLHGIQETLQRAVDDVRQMFESVSRALRSLPQVTPPAAFETRRADEVNALLLKAMAICNLAGVGGVPAEDEKMLSDNTLRNAMWALHDLLQGARRLVNE